MSTIVQTVLWGGPLDGQILNVDDPPKSEMVVAQLTQYPPEYAGEELVLIRHHYVFDSTSRRYNYAGDWR